MLATNWDFPVELRKLRTVDGLDVPHSRAVVRSDTNQPIATVSDKYKIITHRTFSDTVTPFVKAFGQPEIEYNTAKNGAYFAVEYLFRNHSIEIGGRNRVAMRLILTNAYYAGCAARLRVAALVLECLNCGIFAEKDIFNLSVRHVGDTTKVDFPTPEKVLSAFTSGAAVYGKFAKMELAEDKGQHFFLEDEKVVNALPEGQRESIAGRWSQHYGDGQRTVWDLLQHATYEITHRSPRLSYTGRLQRLQKTARLFNHVFAGY